MKLANDLTELLQKYGPAMARAAERTLKPIYDPAAEPTPQVLAIREALKRVEARRSESTGSRFAFFPSQTHKVSAAVLGLEAEARIWLTMEMGAGKTCQSIGAAYAFFNAVKKHPRFRALVMCPGHITKKWKREIEWAIPGVHVTLVKKFEDLVRFQELAPNHPGPAFVVISKETAKLGFRIEQPAAAKRYLYEELIADKDAILPGDKVIGPHEDLKGYYRLRRPKAYAACPTCGVIARHKSGDTENPLPYDWYMSDEWDEPAVRCGRCGDLLATNARTLRPGVGQRPHLDRYIQRKMRGFFDLLIADEVHELASSDTIQGNTFGTLASACRYTMALTGTLSGGYVKDLHAPLWRISPDLMRLRGFDLSALRGGRIGAIGRNCKAFNQRYGVMEHKVVRDVADGHRGRIRRGRHGRKSEYKTDERPRPGISPDVFNHYLIGRSVFMELAELGPALPSVERVLIPCSMSPELRAGYAELDGKIQDMMREKRWLKGILAAMRVQVLDAYLDKPYGWDWVTCPEMENGVRVGTIDIALPQDLGDLHDDAKDAKLVEYCKAELAQGRRCAIYPVFTGKHDVRPKLQKVLESAGLRVTPLPDHVSPSMREEWIEKRVAETDVLIAHPKRVMTGLDLIQFPTLIWYQLGYSTHVLRQASARARRPIQKLPCKVVFFYYENTIQQQALRLMGEKEAASQAIEGVFDVNALKAMMNGGEDSDVLSALARQLEREMGDPRDAWKKIDEAENHVSAPFIPALREPKQAERTEDTSSPATKRTVIARRSSSNTRSSDSRSLFDDDVEPEPERDVEPEPEAELEPCLFAMA